MNAQARPSFEELTAAWFDLDEFERRRRNEIAAIKRAQYLAGLRENSRQKRGEIAPPVKSYYSENREKINAKRRERRAKRRGLQARRLKELRQ